MSTSGTSSMCSRQMNWASADEVDSATNLPVPAVATNRSPTKKALADPVPASPGAEDVQHLTTQRAVEGDRLADHGRHRVQRPLEQVLSQDAGDPWVTGAAGVRPVGDPGEPPPCGDTP